MDLGTLFGVLGVIANTVWPLIKRRRYLLVGQMIACVLMTVHFVLLGTNTGALVMFVAGVQAALAIPLESHPKFKTVYLFSLLLMPFVCWLTWQGTSSLFSSLALTFFCLGNLQVNTKYLRICLLLCLFCWIGHNLYVLSYPALTSNAFALVTSVYGLLREFKLNKISVQSHMIRTRF